MAKYRTLSFKHLTNRLFFGDDTIAKNTESLLLALNPKYFPLQSILWVKAKMLLKNVILAKAKCK